MTLAEVSAEVRLRVRRRLQRGYRRLLDDPDHTYVSDKQLAQALDDITLSALTSRLRAGESPQLTPGLDRLDRTAALVRQLFPESAEQTRREADDLTGNRIALFGRTFDFGERIDWHLDPEAGVRWPLEHYTRVPIVVGRLADARVVWELNRLHHLTTLGRAYALTRDERYTIAFIGQVTSWCEANPPRFGINWTVAMEAGIRAVNLILALDLFRASPLLTDVVIELLLKILLAHGQFIRRNLEFSYRVTSNHYLSDLIGLFAIGTVIPYFKESRGWATFAAREVVQELKKQVREDGADDEASIAYHRLVLEIFTLFVVLMGDPARSLSDDERRRFEAMFEFTRAYLKPDLTSPVLGDSDDGRLIKFKTRPPVDHGYLLSLAAILLRRSEFKLSARIDEEALWWFGEEGLKTFEQLPVSDRAPASQAFREAQVFIQRRDSLYAIVDGGDNGLNGRGSHAHSDALSFELFAYGQTFLRDPGTYVYTTSQRWRHLFRSTAYHNTVRIDRQEINAIRFDQPFSAGRNVRPKVNAWTSDEERDVLDAEHDGYARLAKPVTHRRVLTFHKREAYWTLEDRFTGSGHHLFEICFHFDPGVEVRVEEDGRVIASSRSHALAIIPLSGHPFAVKRARRWVSPSYRTRLRSSAIIYHLRADAVWNSVMLLVPYVRGEEARLSVVRRLAADEFATER